MKKRSFTSIAASVTAAVSVSLSAWAFAQQQTPTGGGKAEQRSSQGTSSADGGSGQNSTGSAPEGGNPEQGTGNANRGSGVQRSVPSSQADSSRQDRSDRDASGRRDTTTTRDSATKRDTTDSSATDSPERGARNRVDSRRGNDDQDDSADRTKRDFGTGRDKDDDSDDRSSERDDANRIGDHNDRERQTRDRDDDQADRTDLHRDVDFGARFTTDSSNRLVVRDLQSRGIFGRAGLRDNDVIISVNGQRVSSWPVLQRLLIAADSRVPLVIWRDGVQQTVYIEEFGVETRNRTNYGYDEELYQTDRAWLGVFLDTRYDNAVVVQAVQEGSAADDAGIRAGDRILSINDRRVQTPAQLTQIVGSMEPGDRVDINVARWQTRQVDVELGERPATSRFRYLEDGDASSTQPKVFDRDDSRDENDAREAIRVQP